MIKFCFSKCVGYFISDKFIYKKFQADKKYIFMVGIDRQILVVFKWYGSTNKESITRCTSMKPVIFLTKYTFI